MNGWFPASDLVGLPGLPSTRRGVQERAKREEWDTRPRKGRGGGFEYCATDLPELTRIAIAQSNTVNAAPPPKVSDAAQDGLAAFTKLPEASRTRAEARAYLVARCKAFVTDAGLGKTKGRQLFADQYNAGQINVENWVSTAVQSVSSRSLHSWSTIWEKKGLAGLADQYGVHRKGAGKIESDAEIRDLVVAVITSQPTASAKLVMRGLRARFEKDRIPAYRTVQAFIANYKKANKQAYTAATNPDLWRSRFQAAGGKADEGVERLNQVWEIDSTPGDVMLADGKRYNIVGIIDVYSRRLLLHVSRSSNSVAVAAAVRKALLKFGVCETLRTDEGNDYTSKHIDRVLLGLGIERDQCAPFTPEAKPFIERAFGTFTRDLVELLDGFIGHNVEQRKAIEGRKSFAARLMKKTADPLDVAFTAEQFQEFCDRWTDTVYSHDEHRGLGGRTPFEVAASWTQPIRQITDERALDILLAEAPGDGWRMVTKKGIRVDGANFNSSALGGLEGSQVRCYFDDTDFGSIFVFDEEHNFICVAKCPERTGVSRQEVAAARKAKQKQAVRQQVEVMRQARKDSDIKNLVPDILRERAVASGKLAMFPSKTDAHQTPALNEASIAANIDECPEPTIPSDELEDLDATVFELPRPTPTTQEDVTAQRIDRALAIQAALDASEPVDEDDKIWFEGYRKHPEFIGEMKFREEFGLTQAG